MKLKYCCCGCSLKTGTIIIGVFNIFYGLLDVMDGILTATVFSLRARRDHEVFVGLGATLAVIGWILLVVSICLIIGAANDSPKLLVPWMVYSISFLFVNTIFYIAIGAKFIDTPYSPGLLVGMPFFLMALIYAVLGTYFLLVVLSLYRDMKLKSQPPHGSQPPQAPYMHDPGYYPNQYPSQRSPPPQEPYMHDPRYNPNQYPSQ